MNNSGYTIGVDMGTTSTKAVLFTQTGEVVAKHAVTYPLCRPTPTAAEQNPQEIFAAVITTVKSIVNHSGIDPEQIICLGFSSAMHSLIALDSEDNLLSQSITWADNRSEKWAAKIREEYDALAIYQRTGTPVHSMSPLSKIVWLREEKPELFAQTAKFISIKEYVFHRLFGIYVVDHSIAAATGLLNLASLDWDQKALAIAGITPDKLSQLVPTTHILPQLQTRCALSMGIPAKTPTVIGASDGVLSNLGVGAIEPGIVAVTVGTSGAIRAMVDKPILDPQGRLFCYPLTEKQWVLGGAVNNGGIILRWLRDHLADSEIATARLLKEDAYTMLTAIAQTVPAGAEGLIFHPYLAGERAPLWDANARGSFFGLSLQHGKAHLIRAVLEGVVYNLYLVLTALEETMGEAKSIRATGGFSRSELWRQMLSDVLQREVTVPESYESSCLGAVILGLYALGKVPSLAVVKEMIGETNRHQPIAENVANYQKVIPVYCGLLEVFQEQYGAISQLQAKLSS